MKVIATALLSCLVVVTACGDSGGSADPDPTPVASPSPQASPSADPTPAATPDPTPTQGMTTPDPTLAPTPMGTVAPSPTPAASASPTPQGSPTPAVSPTPQVSPTPTPDPCALECLPRQCGMDSCGNSCGSCLFGEQCNATVCDDDSSLERFPAGTERNLRGFYFDELVLDTAGPGNALADLLTDSALEVAIGDFDTRAAGAISSSLLEWVLVLESLPDLNHTGHFWAELFKGELVDFVGDDPVYHLLCESYRDGTGATEQARGPGLAGLQNGEMEAYGSVAARLGMRLYDFMIFSRSLDIDLFEARITGAFDGEGAQIPGIPVGEIKGWLRVDDLRTQLQNDPRLTAQAASLEAKLVDLADVDSDGDGTADGITASFLYSALRAEVTGTGSACRP